MSKDNYAHFFLEKKIIEEYQNRCSRNSAYSIRAFARDLEIQSGPLSEILAGKRPVSKKMKLHIGSKLKLSVDDLEKIPTLKEYESKDFSFELTSISGKTFEQVSKWYHFAILELFNVVDFEFDSSWIAKRLGVDREIVDEAISNLIDLTLLIENNKGEIVKNPKYKFSSSLKADETSRLKRELQKKIAELSALSIDNVSLDQRDHSGITVAINEESLSEAKALIKNFRQDMLKLFNRHPNKDKVYQLQVSLFPLANVEEQDAM